MSYFNSLTNSNKIGLVVGSIFTVFVVGLLLYLHFFGQPDTEVAHQGFVPEGIVFDIGAPKIARENLDLVDKHLSEIGYGLPRKDGKINVGEGGIQICEGTLENGEKISYPCRPGWVVVTLWDKRMINAEDEAGKAMWKGDHPDHCTIMLPPRVEDSLPIELVSPGFDAEGNVSSGVTLPPEIDAIVEAHEYLHCRGVGHVFTPLPWPFYAIPTGSIMNPSALKAGWGVQGIPPLPKL